MVLSFGRLGRFGGRPTQALPPQTAPERPDGRLIWLQSPTGRGARGLYELARCLADDQGHNVLLTCHEALELPGRLRADLAAPVIFQPSPADRPAEVAGFLQHWRPDLLVLTEGEVPPVLLAQAQESGLAVLMADAHAPRLVGGRDWVPGALRRALAPVRRVLVLDKGDLRAYRRAGVEHVQLGRLEELTPLLPGQDAEREAMARLLASRPVWLAICPSEEEEEAVIAAHRAALQFSHRLLLILVSEAPGRAEAMALRMAEREGWTIARRDRDEDPDPATEVLLFTGCEELGLCLRLAPIAFFGGSLAGAGCQRNPLEAAALGSAILHGPRTGPFGPEIARLGAARAAVAVATPSQLAEALIELQAPDLAARLAGAAWAVVTEGAEVKQEVLDEIARLLDTGSPG